MEPDQPLQDLVRGYLLTRGLELVEMTMRREGRKVIVRLLIDWPEGGITVAECAEVNRALGDTIDEKNLIADSYILEVDSPGLDRPLSQKNDFRRCINQEVKFFLSQPINGKIEIDGIIQEVFDDGIDVLVPSGITRLPFTHIHKAKQLIV